MWTAKIKFSSEETLIGSKAEEYKLDIFAFPLSYTYEKDQIIVQITGTIIGKDKNIKNFINHLKKEERTLNLEINDNFFIGTIKEPSYLKIVYNKDIFHIEPAFISANGYEIITIGCNQRKKLMDIAKILEMKYQGKLIFIKNKKIKSISVMRLHPELTKKQKSAIELAIKHKYYKSPRKISVKQLAEISGLSFSTYQVHLRKAEEKMMPYFFQ